MNERTINTLTLSICIAILPPIWAVLAPHIGIEIGAVALICAGVYATNGNKEQDALRIIIGFIIGDLWACIALLAMKFLCFQEDIEMFITLFILGGLAILIADIFEKFIFSPSLLTGWAIGLVLMSSEDICKMCSLAVQIGIAMIVGVLYVGLFAERIHQYLKKKFLNNKLR